MLSPPGVSLLPTYKVITSPAATGFADIDSGNWDWEYRWSSGAGVQPNPESSSVDEHTAAIRMIIPDTRKDPHPCNDSDPLAEPNCRADAALPDQPLTAP